MTTSSDPHGRLAARARELALAFTARPSVTGTPGEAAFAPWLAALISEHPYFRANPRDVLRQPVPGDPHGRENVIAIVRGEGRRAVLLGGHYDVVPVADYGDLAPLAWHPEPLREALVARLEASGQHPLALDDLRSGAFLPGRGLLDMKSGLAAGLAALEAFAEAPGKLGNLVFLATPDEEDRSAGMRAAADRLPDLMRERSLDVALAINLDALSDQTDGSAGRIVALGCIGKLLLSALVVGRETHACYPFEGVNAAYLAAELVAELEYAPELAEGKGAEIAAPPTALSSRDLKTIYNVTTPGRAWIAWNVLSQRRKAADILEIGAKLAGRAMARARTTAAERAARFAGGRRLPAAWDRIPITTFADVLARAKARRSDFERFYHEQAQALAGRAELDLPSRCRILAELVWEASGLEGSAVVLGFASMPYPAVSMADDALEASIRRTVAEIAAETDTPIGVANYLPVIVDMSFLGPVDAADLGFVAANTPVWGTSISWNPEAAGPGYPVVNAGPWGRDYHTPLERVHVAYAFDVLPRLVAALARTALAPPTSRVPGSP